MSNNTGVVVALGSSHWIKPLLSEESTRDPPIFVAMAAILLAVAAQASVIPARRAARVDPMRVLRTD